MNGSGKPDSNPNDGKTRSETDADAHEPEKVAPNRLGRIGIDRWIELILAFAIAGAAITQCSVANRQWAAMNATNQIATRPYIKVILEPSTFNVRIVPNRDYRNDLAGVKFRVENTGRMPALLYIQSSANWNGRAHPGDEKNWPSIAVSGRKFLFPDDKQAEFTSYIVGFSQGQLMDIATGDRFYVMVDVRYGPLKRGFPSDAYETRVCTVFQMKRGTDLITLGEGEPCPSKGSNYAK